MSFTPLILAGGKSTRMGTPKHLLPMPDGRPLYQHQIDVLARVCPEVSTIYISLAPDSQVDDYLGSLPNHQPNTITDPAPSSPEEHQDSPRKRSIAIIADNPSPSSTSTSKNETSPISGGPSLGLLAAHRSFPSTTFLVIACDHPLLNASALQHLCHEYQPPVTCFRNAEGFCEPLLGVWGPEALGELARRVESAGKHGGRGNGIGPCGVVKALGGKMVDVDVDANGEEDGRVLMGVNTPEEWEVVRGLLERGFRGGVLN